MRRTICSPTRSACEYSERLTPDRRRARSRRGESELGEPRARVHLERLADLHVGLVALFERREDLDTRRLASASDDAVDRTDNRRLPGRRRLGGKQVPQKRDGRVLPQVGRGDTQRVEHASERGVGPQRDTLDVGRNLLEQVKAMIPLGVAVDHARALQEALILELLCERRLARSERPDAQDRRVAVTVGSLAEVEAHGPP
jgi:hypothetical protein